MALIANINDIDDDLRAIEPPTWHEFLQKYLVPATALEYGNETGILSDQTSALACSLKYFDVTAFLKGAIGTLEDVFGLIAFEANRTACDPTNNRLENQNKKSFDFNKNLRKYYESGDSFLLEIIRRFDERSWKNNYTGWAATFRVLNALTFCDVTNLLKKIIECLLRGKPFEDVVPLIVNTLLKDFI